MGPQEAQHRICITLSSKSVKNLEKGDDDGWISSIRTSSPTTSPDPRHGKVSTSSAAPLCIDYGHQFKLGAPTSPDPSFFPVGRRAPSPVDPRRPRCSDVSGLPELVIRTAVSPSADPFVWHINRSTCGILGSDYSERGMVPSPKYICFPLI